MAKERGRGTTYEFICVRMQLWKISSVVMVQHG